MQVSLRTAYFKDTILKKFTVQRCCNSIAVPTGAILFLESCPSKWRSWSNSELIRSARRERRVARAAATAAIVLLREPAAKSFLPVQVGYDRVAERAARDVWGFKEWFPVAHHSSAPVKASPRRFIGCVYTGSGWIFFEENFAGVSVSAGKERSSYREQITHLSERVKTKDRVTDAGQKTRFSRTTASRIALANQNHQITIAHTPMMLFKTVRLYHDFHSPHFLWNDNFILIVILVAW